MPKSRLLDQGRGAQVRVAPVALAGAALLLGCGKTEKEGSIGDELTANGIEVTVDRVDRSPPEPRRDITGLSKPAAGKRLVGVHARVCSDHGGAIGPYNFRVESSAGAGRLKFPARNYRDDFEKVRDGCGEGWIVFEIPGDAKPERVRFEFEDTGSTRNESDRVKAKFSWKVG